MVDLNALSDILTYGTILVGIQLILSVASVFTPLPTAWFCSALQHLSAGVVAAAVAVELLPLLLTIFTPTAVNYVVVISGFTFGVVSFSLLGYFLSQQEHQAHQSHHEQHHSSLGASSSASELVHPIDIPEQLEPPPTHGGFFADRCRVLASGESQFGMHFVVAAGLFLDGMLYSLSYVRSATTGLIIAIAFGVETGVLGLLTSVSLRKSGAARWRVMIVAFAYTMLTFVGCLIGAVSFTPDGIALSLFFLAFASAVFLYMVVDSLLVEARMPQIRYVWASKFAFYVGFCGIFYLQLALI